MAFLELPPEVHLSIFSYLDLPDLAVLSRLAPRLAQLAADPVLHQERLRVVTPSRVRHSLFATSSQGVPLRPTVGDLVHRGVIRGLGIERRWRMGQYFYSQHSIIQYEAGRRLSRQHTRDILSDHLKRRPEALGVLLKSFHGTYILPDVEFATAKISRSLLPTVRKLKWSLHCDQIAKKMRESSHGSQEGQETVNFGVWLEKRGRGVVQDTERVLLALCPGIRGVARRYEALARSI
ncbi:hypothetical protein BDN72DRAFT_953835 [Pluteus cervinus]|uniref:Uncharacterized protein n=1 Tax=Pluteus cervinus TaxID=181527 RepID=A0ACD3BGR5_9AGAR|nr:hypothetical protein BDN72DRAFT_953835 [Pluteus cervinus]